MSALGFPSKDVEYPELENWDWWQLYIWQSIRRSAGQNQGGTATIVIGLIAIGTSTMIGLGGVFRDRPEILIPALIATVAVTIYLLILLACWAAYAALRTAPPDVYADIVLPGKGESQCLRLLAYEMLSGCEAFVSSTEGLVGLPEEIRLIRFQENDNAAGKLKIEGVISSWNSKYEKFKKDLPKQAEYTQRLGRLQQVASSQLDIHPDSLCQSILVYSPTTHKELVIEFDRVCARMLSECRNAVKDDLHLWNALVYSERCKGIIGYFGRWARSLKQLYDFDYLHLYLHRIASKHSTSGAVEEYAYALQAIAAQQLARLDRTKNTDETSRRRLLELGIVELSYIHERQKAYPGLNVHSTLKNLCSNAYYQASSDEIGVREKDLEDLADVLGAIENNHSLTQYFVEETQQARARYEVLRRCPDIVNLCLFWSREVLSERLSAVIDCWADDPSKLIVLTHGFSKTVRDALKKAAHRLGENQPTIFVTDTNGTERTESSGDAGWMAHGLEQSIRAEFGARIYTGKIISGDSRLLSDLSPSGKLLVILGAECFSDNGKAIHPRGALEMIVNLISTKRDCLIVILAESYKKRDVDSLISGSDLMHMQRLDVYTPKHIDMILSDELVINTGRQKKEVDAIVACAEKGFAVLREARLNRSRAEGLSD